MEKPGETPAKPQIRPGSTSDVNPSEKDRQKQSEDARHAGENYNEKHDDKKRYDEADPNWRNPDVEMDSQLDNQEINPELDANIGPQS